MKKILLVLVLLFISVPVFAADMHQYIDENGVLHVTIDGSGDNKYQKKPELKIDPPVTAAPKIPTWKDELDDICAQAKIEGNNMAPEANDSQANNLLEKVKDLRSVIENMNTNESLKYVNLRLLKSCENLINISLNSRKQRRDYNNLQQSLKDKLK